VTTTRAGLDRENHMSLSHADNALSRNGWKSCWTDLVALASSGTIYAGIRSASPVLRSTYRRPVMTLEGHSLQKG
jgi:hypothetical protein